MAVRFRSLTVLILGLLLALGSAVASAQEAAPRRLNPSEVAAYFDNLFISSMARDPIAGAVVAVVQGEEIIFSRGYGMADVESGRSVEPDSTVFRLASVTKLFTATAVMQLVERGLIDLNADVNTYLDFTIPDTFPEAITVLDLIDHTPGFEDWFIGSRQPVDAPFPPLRDVVVANLPERIYPPGTVTAYSNYGMALAAYVVERVSGLSYSDYVEERIFVPLGMTHSTATQPIPAPLDADTAISYRWLDGRFIAQPFEVVLTTSSGGLSASGSDMARFMLMHLNGGRFGDTRLLSEETTVTMHSRSFSNHPRVNGIAHGFAEREMFGQHIIEHGGDLYASAAVMLLLPEHQTGLFIAINQHGRVVEELRRSAWVGFVEQFFGSSALTAHTSSVSDDVSPALAGFYVGTRRSLSKPDKLGAMLGMISTLTIQSQPDGSLLVNGDRYIETEPLVYQWTQDRGYGSYIIFSPLANGGYEVFANNITTQAFRPVPWYELPTVNFVLLGFTLVVAIMTISVSLFALLRRRLDRIGGVAFAVGVLIALIVAGLGIVLGDPMVVGMGLPPLFYGVSTLTLVLVATLALFLIALALGWAKEARHWMLRLHYGLVLAAGTAFVFFLHTWNLLGFRA